MYFLLNRSRIRVIHLQETRVLVSQNLTNWFKNLKFYSWNGLLFIVFLFFSIRAPSHTSIRQMTIAAPTGFRAPEVTSRHLMTTCLHTKRWLDTRRGIRRLRDCFSLTMLYKNLINIVVFFFWDLILSPFIY